MTSRVQAILSGIEAVVLDRDLEGCSPQDVVTWSSLWVHHDQDWIRRAGSLLTPSDATHLPYRGRHGVILTLPVEPTALHQENVGGALQRAHEAQWKLWQICEATMRHHAMTHASIVRQRAYAAYAAGRRAVPPREIDPARVAEIVDRRWWGVDERDAGIVRLRTLLSRPETFDRVDPIKYVTDWAKREGADGIWAAVGLSHRMRPAVRVLRDYDGDIAASERTLRAQGVADSTIEAVLNPAVDSLTYPLPLTQESLDGSPRASEC